MLQNLKKKSKRSKIDNILFFPFFEKGFANKRLKLQSNAAFQSGFALSEEAGIKTSVSTVLKLKKQKKTRVTYRNS